MPHGDLKAELYDLGSDPSETRERLADHPEIAEKLTAQITEIVRRGRTTPGPRQANDTGYWHDLTWMSEAEFDGKGPARHE